MWQEKRARAQQPLKDSLGLHKGGACVSPCSLLKSLAKNTKKRAWLTSSFPASHAVVFPLLLGSGPFLVWN